MEIQKLSASLSLFPDSSAFGLKTTCWLQHFSNNNKKRLENTRINIDASIYKGKRDSMFTIPNFELGLNSALLAGKGFIPVANPHLYTFTFEGKNNLDLLKLLLTEEAGKHIEAGDINFTGIVKGLKNRQVPFVDIRSNINQMQISVPKLEYNVSELNFKAHLNTGTHSDMTDAFLILDTLHAVFPENYLQFKGAVRNLKTPSFEMNGRADINLQNLSRLVNFNRIKDLGGDLYFELDFLGVTLNEKVWRATAYNHTSVSLNNVAFTLPGIGSVEQLNAEFSGNMDSIYLDTLHFISGNSDLSIRGEILHTKAIIAESAMETVADLHILSTHLDLPEFLQYYPSVKKGFNYQFKEVDLHTTLTMQTKNGTVLLKHPRCFSILNM